MTNQDQTQASKLKQVAEGVFLTPRVLDQRAFEDLTGAIKAIIAEAIDRGQALGKASADVRGVTDTVRQTTSALHARMETAAKLIPILDQMIKGAQGAVMPDEAMIAVLAAKAVDRAVTDRRAAFEPAPTVAPVIQSNITITPVEVAAQIAAATAVLEARLAETERSSAERISSLEAQITDKTVATADSGKWMIEAGQAALRLERGVEASKAMVEQATHATRQLDEVRAQADRIRLNLGQELIQAAAQADMISSRVMELTCEIETLANLVDQNKKAREESTKAMAAQWPALREMASAATDTMKTAENTTRERLAELEREVQNVRASIASVVAAETPKLHELTEAQQRVRSQIEQTVKAAERVEKFSMERLAELRDLESTIAGVRETAKAPAFVAPPIARGAVMTEVKSAPRLKFSGVRREGRGEKNETKKGDRVRAVKLKRKSA